FATHAPIEPQVGVADVQADRATVWTSTQAPFSVRSQIAEVTGLKDEQITVVPLLIGGGFGRKSVSDAAYEAAQLSKAAGRPVRVAWSRSEEFSHGFMRPPTLTSFSAALDDSGQIAAWQQDLTSGFVIFTFFPAFLRLVFGSDFGATRGAVGPYVLSNQRVTATMKDLPVKTASWRGLGVGPNAFAVEQFMDELALAAGEDPLAFRLRYLPSDGAQGPATRMRRVLETAAQAANWGSPLPPDTGRGIACGMDAGTYVAEVAEVHVDRERGAVQVLRVHAAIDCGLVINPDTVTAQAEGGIMMGLSAALKEEITLKDGKWSAGSFAEYPFFTMADAPEIEVTLIENRETAPSGMGEPPLMPAAAAVGNAIAAAVGARVRTMPMTPERILAALREQQG
ncbi:MAG: xanthine dehydrogenase family protein molybdopterin-binding subunit, partial [Chloroflexi bacterium]|nr:xanthine dehydrogenase family protein molybdopterin-binding subunit [Chloroflexota bacterium]